MTPRPDFVERIRLHELAAGSRASVLLPLADTLHRDARLLVGTARRIDADARTVTVATAGGDITERYDFLIYAPGSAATTPMPGAREHAHLLADLDGAQTAAHRLAGSAAGSRVVVVGGGFTGVEAAAEIAERRPGLDVTLLFSGPVATQMRPQARGSIHRALTRLGIHLWATSRSLTLRSCDSRLSTANARSAVIFRRSIRMPSAWPMTVRVTSPLRRCASICALCSAMAA